MTVYSVAGSPGSTALATDGRREKSGVFRALGGAMFCALAFAAQAGQVTLAWDASSGSSVTGYYIHYGTASGNYPSRVNAGNLLSYPVNNLAAGQTYYFVVTAYNASGAESSYSNEAYATIAADPTQTQLASTTNPAAWGANVVFTATVTGSSPTGAVAFRANGTLLAGCSAVALAGSGNARSALCATSSLAPGTYSVVASYSGNTANAPSSSIALTQAVNKAASVTTLTSTPNPSPAGSTVLFTANVLGTSPTGSVSFSADGSVISGCSARGLSGSGNVRTATCSTSALGTGNRAIRVTYGGDANHLGSTGNGLNQLVYSGPLPVSPFSDVPVSHWAYAAISAVAYHGITLGCASAPMRFCPDDLVARDSMTVFLERAIRGPAHPYAPTGNRFADVPLSHWAVGPIEQAYADGITLGCASSPLRFCPDHEVSRAEMAIFLLRARFGGGYDPGTATGTMFSDVPVTHWAAAWIERFASLGYTTGCATNPVRFCPDAYTARATMAVFMQRVFNLAGPPP